MKSRVVISGLGLVTPIGIGVEEFWQASLQGRSGVDRISAFDPSLYSTQIAAELKGFDPQAYMSAEMFQNYERVHQIGLVAALLALEDSGLVLDSEDRTRIGTCAGSVLGAMLVTEERLSALYLQERGQSEVRIREATTLGNFISDIFDCKGPSITLSNACTTGNHVLGWAYNILRLGKADVVIAGSAEAPILPLITAGFCALRVMSRRNNDPRRASRPFDRERDGFVLGEGGACLILETLEHARDRGARIYAEVSGYSMTGEAYHMVMPSPSVEEIATTMALALADADVRPEEVNYINAHGTSTTANDIGETRAIKALFGERAHIVPISATKSMIGHTIGAAGAIEAAVSALAIHDGVVPPTINYEVPDPECDLDYVPNEARALDVKVALTNSFGFGSNNSSIVLRKFEG